jgi:hypothetical protein
MEPNLGQALHLINGENCHAKIKEGAVVKQLLDEGKTPEAVTSELYLRCLSRPPTDEESKAIGEQLAGNADRQAALEDVFWALLNSREFIFNH